MVCNREEAATLCGRTPTDDPGSLLDGMLALGPGHVVITDGPAGAWGAEGTLRYRVPIYPDRTPVVDRTGAGDAFAATLVAVIATGRPLDEAMLWAPVNSMSVVALGRHPGRAAPSRRVGGAPGCGPGRVRGRWDRVRLSTAAAALRRTADGSGRLPYEIPMVRSPRP